MNEHISLKHVLDTDLALAEPERHSFTSFIKGTQNLHDKSIHVQIFRTNRTKKMAVTKSIRDVLLRKPSD